MPAVAFSSTRDWSLIVVVAGPLRERERRACIGDDHRIVVAALSVQLVESAKRQA